MTIRSLMTGKMYWSNEKNKQQNLSPDLIEILLFVLNDSIY